MFIGDASAELAAVTVAAIGLCAITGIWLAASPSIGIGVAAGVSLAILGIIDFLLGTAESSGPMALLPPLIDFGFSIRVFAGCGAYANAL